MSRVGIIIIVGIIGSGNIVSGLIYIIIIDDIIVVSVIDIRSDCKRWSSIVSSDSKNSLPCNLKLIKDTVVQVLVAEFEG